MQPWFIATETFDPSRGEGWSRYIEWSGLTQLREVVSLDPMLCPTVLPETKDHYWPYIVNEAYMLDYFTSLPVLLGEIAGIESRNLLAVFRNPEFPPSLGPGYDAFRFVGHDLVDLSGLASALTNCGGFPGAFSNDEISDQGLLTSHARAFEVQGELRRLYPEEHHAYCDVWAIFRNIES
ncbi:hypothetical protein P12x_000016 [Tundrisphaera lichenicola]|uniref:hypothetical protein n=1 Tax=Tundrisphaera lichenicola TaxID=2029860 RepID=UPI003EB6FF8F